jgi:quercetin dioxygenase-like cupin family protein
MIASTISTLGVSIALAQDPLKVAPDMYKLLSENDRIRVMEVTFAPGGKIAKHSHPDHMAYAVSGGKLRISKPDGTSQDLDAKTGDVFWLPAETHWGENIGETTIRILVVELKEPAQIKKTAAPTAEKTK